MSGSYIDPCESGAYQGSGSVGSEGSGSWNGSGSGNDSITSENCCPQPLTGKCCCGPQRLKMRLYQTTGHEQPAAGWLALWGTVEDSRVYTLKKTIYCANTNEENVRWVIEDPDSTFGDWGDLTGAYFECKPYLNPSDPSAVPYYFSSLSLPNSPVASISISGSANWGLGSLYCKCHPASAISDSNMLVSSGESYGSTTGYSDIPNVSNKKHTFIVWGENVDWEECLFSMQSPPQFLLDTIQRPTSPCAVDYYGNRYPAFTSASWWTGGRRYFKRVAYRKSYPSQQQVSEGDYVGSNLDFQIPYASYIPCDWLKKSTEMGPGYIGSKGWTFLVYRTDNAFWPGMDQQWWLPNSSAICPSVSDGTTNIRIERTGWLLWEPVDYIYIGNYNWSRRIAQYHTPPIVTPERCVPTVYPMCVTRPLSRTPVYDILYHPYIRQYIIGVNDPLPPNDKTPNCVNNISPAQLKCEDYISTAVSNGYNRHIITEATGCLVPIPPYIPPTPPTSGVVPGFPTPQPPPESGSTPSQSGSAPFSGSGSQPPCGGDCSYNLGYAWFTGTGQQWTLMYKYSSSTCTEWCSCDTNVVGEIYVTYNGPEGGWPAVLHLPCVPSSVQGSTPGSTSEE